MPVMLDGLRKLLGRGAVPTLLLAFAVVLHASRVIWLSFALPNEEFGAFATLLLLSVMFAEFGNWGFAQLIYNQKVYEPRCQGTELRNVSALMTAALVISSVMAVALALFVSQFTVFGFVQLLATLACSGVNLTILAACRASSSKYTYPFGYLIKASVVLVDVAVLIYVEMPIENMVLFGELLAAPLLSGYAFYLGLWKSRSRLCRHALLMFRRNIKSGLAVVVSSSTALLFFNQDRMLAATLFNLSDMGIFSKLLMPKIIGAQLGFLFSVQFHRWLIANQSTSIVSKVQLMHRMEKLIALPLVLILFVGGFTVVLFYDVAYNIEVHLFTGFLLVILACIYFANPYAVLLQASGNFKYLTLGNVLGLIAFAIVIIFIPFTPASVLSASAFSAIVWLVGVRRFVFRLF